MASWQRPALVHDVQAEVGESVRRMVCAEWQSLHTGSGLVVWDTWGE